MAFDKKINKLGTLMTLSTILLIFIGNYMSFQLLSSISVTNYFILKQLYPLLTDKNFNRRVLRRRIDSFIARLNTEFIGFHCWFYIKFKRYTFYEYLIGLSSTYLLYINYKSIASYELN